MVESRSIFTLFHQWPEEQDVPLQWLSGKREALKRFRSRASERLGLLRFKETVLERRVPETPWYQGDGATLTTLLAVQVITGATMTLFYSNSIDYAYKSVWNITHNEPMGWLVRGIHYWSAGIMVVMLISHFFRHLLLGGYKPPREGAWTIGVIQFFLVLTMSFTGYALRWDERSIYAVRVVLNMFNNVPLIGDDLVLLVQGGSEIGSMTLSRFFSVHVIIVPLLLLGLVGFHLYLVVIHGVTSRAEREQPVESAREQKKVYKKAAESKEAGEWFHPHTVLLTGTMAFTVFCIVYVLALAAGPRELYPEANLTEPSMPMEEWWFAWYSSLIALMPRKVVPVFYWAFPLLLFFSMLLLPLLDRGPNRGVRRRPIWAVFVSFCIIGLIALSVLRMKSPWTGWPSPNPPPIPSGIVLNETAERGRILFARKGCNSCHAVSSHGRKVGPDLARIEHRLSPTELGNYILSPPEGVPMPSYRGILTREELDSIVDFVLVAQTFPRQ
jgi:ubiquinol-cytochrome c reductase cytochrome b subunit